MKQEVMPEATIHIQQGSRFGNYVKGAALAGGVAAAAAIYGEIKDINWPNLGFGGADSAKEAVDEFFSDISNRTVEPLVIKPEDVVMGEIDGIESFGKAERTVTVTEANKKYDSKWPGGDDHVRLVDGIFVIEAGVHGGAKVTMDRTTNRLTVTLNAPTTNNSVRVVQDSIATNKPGPLAQVGQLGGDETSTAPAKKELHDYILNLQQTDQELYDTAACTGINAVGRLAQQILEASGLHVFIDGDQASQTVLVGMENPSLSRYLLSLSVQAYGKPTPGLIGPELPKYNWENCRDIIATTSQENDDLSYGVLTSQGYENITLKTEKK